MAMNRLEDQVEVPGCQRGLARRLTCFHIIPGAHVQLLHAPFNVAGHMYASSAVEAVGTLLR